MLGQFAFPLFLTGDKSLPPKLEPSDSIPPLIHSEADPEPPTLKPIDVAPDCEDKSSLFDGELPDLLSSAPCLNGHSHSDSLQSSLLDVDMSVVATSTVAEPTGAVNRRTAVLFRKSKVTSPHKAPKSGDMVSEEADVNEGEGEEEEDEAKSILSMVIPKLENLLHNRKRKHSGSRHNEEERVGEELEEKSETPVKRLDRG